MREDPLGGGGGILIDCNSTGPDQTIFTLLRCALKSGFNLLLSLSQPFLPSPLPLVPRPVEVEAVSVLTALLVHRCTTRSSLETRQTVVPPVHH